MQHLIPHELRTLPQWVAAGTDKQPINPRTGRLANVTDPATWGTFEEARLCGTKHVGFVLSKSDPYTIIDLDSPVNDEQTKRHSKIFEAFESYAELSQSGKGIHIIVRGQVASGVRKDKVEVYSQDRYMICTGVVYKDYPIVDQQALLDVLYKEMKSTREEVDLEQVDAIATDEQIWDMAQNAVNGDKFLRLWKGEWAGAPEWPSQSEADMALMAMLAFYSRDNEQCRRLFRMSALGKRDKAQRDSYLNYALRKYRAKEVPPVDLLELKNRALAFSVPPEIPTPTPPPPPKPRNATALPALFDASLVPPAAEPVMATGGAIFPPGLIGELAEYFFSSAIRPVREIALVSALALVAGVAARSYNISGTGLNQYLIILAKTGSGKEAAGKFIDAMITAVRPTVPMADQFVGPGAFASGQALVKTLSKRPCFVSVLGEVGITIQQMCDPRAPAAQVMLKKVLLDIYGKSGWTSLLHSSVYSDAEKDTKIVQAPNVTIFGEGTPDTFYGGLDQTHIAEGLVPRFLIVEYNGPRPARNPRAFFPPPEDLVAKFAELCTTALCTFQNNVCAPVQIDPQAEQVLDGFDTEADGFINSASADIQMQLWNRAHLKSLKLSGLVAVGACPSRPVVTEEIARWSVALVRKDIEATLKRFADGDLGQGANKQEAEVRAAVKAYMEMNAKTRKGYKVPDALVENNALVPYGYLRRWLRLRRCFREDKLGATLSVQRCLDDMVKAEALVLLPPAQAKAEFGTTAAVYGLGANW